MNTEGEKVYLIWYECDLGKALWGVCKSIRTAERIIWKIEKNLGYKADWTDEPILED